MIFKLTFLDKTEWAQAKSELHLLQSYEKEHDDFHDILEVEEIEPNEAKKIMVKNNNYDEDDPDDLPEIPLYNMIVGDDFSIVASTDWID